LFIAESQIADKHFSVRTTICKMPILLSVYALRSALYIDKYVSLL